MKSDSSLTAGDDHGYLSSMFQWSKNKLMYPIKPNYTSQKSAPADTTDGHSYLNKPRKKSLGDQIKPNYQSVVSYLNDHFGASDKSGYDSSSSGPRSMDKIKPSMISTAYNRMGAFSSSGKSYIGQIGEGLSKMIGDLTSRKI